MLIGSVTSFLAATTGLFQNDLKKVIAYSTCSQLLWFHGFIVFYNKRLKCQLRCKFIH